jgi:phosphoribosylanthranilate isomerase
MSLWVKICGNTSLHDAQLAAEAGADAVGFVFAPSQRRVTAAEVAAISPQLPATLEKIGVFVETGLDEICSTVRVCGLTGVQLHSEAGPSMPAKLRERLGPELRILRVVHFDADAPRQMVDQIAQHDRNLNIDAVLVDSRTATTVGGTGVTFDWASARTTLFRDAMVCKRIAAGGLSPSNVAQAIAMLRPWGVDVVSGVESTPGIKDPYKVRAFVERARAADLG